MKRFAAVLGGLALALTPSVAQAVELVRADGVTPIPRLQAIVDAADHMPTVAGPVRVIYGATHTYYYRVPRTIYVGAGRPLSEDYLWHELGHDYDLNELTDERWQVWATDMGVSGDRYFQGNDPFNRYEPGTFAINREYFADWYEICATRGRAAILGGGDYIMGGYQFSAPRSRYHETCRKIWRY